MHLKVPKVTNGNFLLKISIHNKECLIIYQILLNNFLRKSMENILE